MTMAHIRDRIAHAIANWVLRTIASEEYQERLEFVYVTGMDELDRRADEELKLALDRASRRKDTE